MQIPPYLAHLPVHRGYPVPYFVAYLPDAEGVKRPDFRIMDAQKQHTCLKYSRCAICGKPLPPGQGFIVSGPKGFKNRVSTDTPMHERCARYSLAVCPHLVYRKHERREEYPEGAEAASYQAQVKPDEFCLVKIDKYELIRVEGRVLLNYRPVAVQWFEYVGATLTAIDEGLEPVAASQWRNGLPRVQL